jgi:nucleoside-diphosphate-sugar epimerase
MRALVTGGGGFLGRYVVEQSLARGDEVTAFARGAYPALEEIGIRLVRGDLADAATVAAACAGIDVVYHVASKTGYWGSWDAFYQANVVGTRNVIAACLANAVPKLVYTSTPSVVFSDEPHEGADESLPYPERYENNYSRSKAIAERAVMGANAADHRPHRHGARAADRRRDEHGRPDLRRGRGARAPARRRRPGPRLTRRRFGLFRHPG